MVPESLLSGDALLLGRDDVAGQHRQHGAVHGHRDRDPVERDAVEEDLHVLDRIDGHAGLAHVALHARVVGVVAAVGGQVEGHRDALAAAGERLLVEGVGFLGGGEPGVLADGPGPDRVHGRLRPAHERLEARQGVGVGQSLHVLLRVQRLDGDALGRVPVQGGHVAPRRGLGRGLLPGVEIGRVQRLLTHGRPQRRRTAAGRLIRNPFAHDHHVTSDTDHGKQFPRITERWTVNHRRTAIPGISWLESLCGTTPGAALKRESRRAIGADKNLTERFDRGRPVRRRL